MLQCVLKKKWCYVGFNNALISGVKCKKHSGAALLDHSSRVGS